MSPSIENHSPQVIAAPPHIGEDVCNAADEAVRSRPATPHKPSCLDANTLPPIATFLDEVLGQQGASLDPEERAAFDAPLSQFTPADGTDADHVALWSTLQETCASRDAKITESAVYRHLNEKLAAGAAGAAACRQQLEMLLGNARRVGSADEAAALLTMARQGVKLHNELRFQAETSAALCRSHVMMSKLRNALYAAHEYRLATGDPAMAEEIKRLHADSTAHSRDYHKISSRSQPHVTKAQERALGRYVEKCRAQWGATACSSAVRATAS